MNPLIGRSYYRLIDIDAQGIETASEIRSVEFIEPSLNSVKFYPNPVKRGEEVKIDFTGSSFEPSLIQLMTIHGKLLKVQVKESNNRRILLLPTDGLSSGAYLLRLWSNEGGTKHLKFMVKD